MNEDDANQQKDIGWYNAAVNAWFNTALELDKTLIALSGGGIGLLLSLLSSGKVRNDPFILGLFALSACCFLICVIACLVIFDRNKAYLQRAIAESQPISDPILEKCDSAAKWSFGLGVAATVLVVVLLVSSLLRKDEPVSNETKVSPAGQSLNKSFNNAASLRPQAGTPAATPATTSTPAQSPAATPTPSPSPKNSGQ